MTEQLQQNFILPADKERFGYCLYCKSSIPSKNKEHIFNASWGGKASSNKLICDKCNAQFATTIDQAFKPLVDRTLNMWGMAPTRSKKVPHINIDEDSYIGPFNILYRKGCSFEYSEDDGVYNFKITANSKSEVKRFIDSGEMEKAIGKKLADAKKEKIKSQLSYSFDSASISPQQQMMKISVDLNEQYRSAMHTAIKVILHFTPDMIKKFDFDDAVSFVYSGNGNFRDFAIQTQELFTFPIKTPDANVINIYQSKKYKQIICCFSLLNRIKLSFKMAGYDGSTETMLLVSEGFNGDPDLFAFQTTLPNDISCLPLVKITSNSLSDSDIENHIKELLVGIHCTDKFEVYKNLFSKKK